MVGAMSRRRARASAKLPVAHTRALGQLHHELAESLEHMADHIGAVDVTTSKLRDTRYHLNEALAAASALRTTLQRIDEHCVAMESRLRPRVSSH